LPRGNYGGLTAITKGCDVYEDLSPEYARRVINRTVKWLYWECLTHIIIRR